VGVKGGEGEKKGIACIWGKKINVSIRIDHRQTSAKRGGQSFYFLFLVIFADFCPFANFSFFLCIRSQPRATITRTYKKKMEARDNSYHHALSSNKNEYGYIDMTNPDVMRIREEIMKDIVRFRNDIAQAAKCDPVNFSIASVLLMQQEMQSIRTDVTVEVASIASVIAERSAMDKVWELRMADAERRIRELECTPASVGNVIKHAGVDSRSVIHRARARGFVWKVTHEGKTRRSQVYSYLKRRKSNNDERR
jgi:hypothetical protein